VAQRRSGVRPNKCSTFPILRPDNRRSHSTAAGHHRNTRHSVYAASWDRLGVCGFLEKIVVDEPYLFKTPVLQIRQGLRNDSYLENLSTAMCTSGCGFLAASSLI
jgi:hypothetical protein